MTSSTFEPDSLMTRAQIATVLYNMAGSPNYGTNSGFSDVSSSAWYAKAVTWASKKGIVVGTSSTTFSPDSYVTRQQFAVMLYRYAGQPSVSSNKISSYPDGSSVASWAKNAMNWAVKEKIVTGIDGYLCPNDYAKRCQIIAMIYRYKN